MSIEYATDKRGVVIPLRGRVDGDLVVSWDALQAFARECYIQGRTDSSMNRLRDELRLQAMAAAVLQDVYVYREDDQAWELFEPVIEPRGGTN